MGSVISLLIMRNKFKLRSTAKGRYVYMKPDEEDEKTEARKTLRAIAAEHKEEGKKVEVLLDSVTIEGIS